MWHILLGQLTEISRCFWHGPEVEWLYSPACLLLTGWSCGEWKRGHVHNFMLLKEVAAMSGGALPILLFFRREPMHYLKYLCWRSSPYISVFLYSFDCVLDLFYMQTWCCGNLFFIRLCILSKRVFLSYFLYAKVLLIHILYRPCLLYTSRCV